MGKMLLFYEKTGSIPVCSKFYDFMSAYITIMVLAYLVRVSASVSVCVVCVLG